MSPTSYSGSPWSVSGPFLAVLLSCALSHADGQSRVWLATLPRELEKGQEIVIHGDHPLGTAVHEVLQSLQLPGSGALPPREEHNTNQVVVVVSDDAASRTFPGKITLRGPGSVQDAFECIARTYGTYLLHSDHSMAFCESSHYPKAHLISFAGKAFNARTKQPAAHLDVVPSPGMTAVSLTIDSTGQYLCVVEVELTACRFTYGDRFYDYLVSPLTNRCSHITWRSNDQGTLKSPCDGVSLDTINHLDLPFGLTSQSTGEGNGR